MATFIDRCKHALRHIFTTIGVLVVVGVLGTLAFIYSGLFNVGATVVDSPPLTWFFVTVREASVTFRARDIVVPALDGAEQRDNGFRLYRENCVMCHTPVGRTPTAMAAGFNPQAPGFGEDADDMGEAELFWVTKNGIRFTGMPAWNQALNDQQMWDVVAFLKTLPEMSAADYDALDQRLPLALASQNDIK